jgi:hypothetical protein
LNENINVKIDLGEFELTYMELSGSETLENMVNKRIYWND